ncbi:hypothetical protein HWV62_2137 [Athelia sp. TMB]|nr:hypothetical protein HWV62_2137 [Athelia sp. TMB]
MASSLEQEIDIGQISIAKYSNSPPSPATKRSDRPNGRHHRRMSSMSHPDFSELKALEVPSSPTRNLARSKTLPRHVLNPLAKAQELDGLPVDRTKLPKLRRWMLAFLILTSNWDPQFKAPTHPSGSALLKLKTCLSRVFGYLETSASQLYPVLSLPSQILCNSIKGLKHIPFVYETLVRSERMPFIQKRSGLNQLMALYTATRSLHKYETSLPSEVIDK